MSGRREIQQQHERAVVSDFLEWLAASRKVSFRVVEEPNPPEAIIQSPRLTRWVEVVEAPWSEAWSRDQFTYATPGDEHRPIGDGPFLEPDAAFAQSFVRSVSKKLGKSSYLPFAEKYGPGYLVVNVDYPLYDHRAHKKARQFWEAGRPWFDRGCFRDIFMRIRMYKGYRFQRWAP